MWLFGLSIVTVFVLAKATAPDADLNVEAAFQGRCGHGSPCEQLCYELHDGMYECDCSEGFELNKNGYSCEEINSTFSSNDDVEEDVLYQKGASFSAKLDDSNIQLINYNNVEQNDLDDSFDEYDNLNSNNNKNDNKNHVKIKNRNKFNPSSTSDGSFTFAVGAAEAMLASSTTTPPATTSEATVSSTQTPSQQLTTTLTNRNIELSKSVDNFYSKEDMSIYDDVNNNKLKLKQYDFSIININNNNLNVNKNDSENINNNSNLNVNSLTSKNNLDNVEGGIAANYTTNLNNFIDNSTQIISEPCTLDCGFEGICSNADGASRCLCPFGKMGHKCEEDAKINIPRFNKLSWLAFPALRGAYKHVQLHIEFRPESFDGIILLTGERDDLTGDYMALLIHQGFVEFWFDCGSGSGRVKSEETVLLNQWNTVTIYRHRWDAWMQLNQGNRVQGRSKGLFSRITFREPVFLGGSGNITGLTNKLPITDGMIGCIRKFIANEHEYGFSGTPFGDVTQGFDIQECITDRCSRYPCHHGGKCLPSDEGAICLCPLGFGGDLCDMRLDLQVPLFNGSSYLRFAPLGDTTIIWLELKVIIKPQQDDGLLLYSGHHEYGDYISLCLNQGYVEFTFDLGSGPAVVRSEFPLQLGQWHTIRVSRTARLAVLRIDQLPEVMTISPNGFWHLSLPHSLFLGGVHNTQTLPISLKEKGSFVGCIQKVEINNKPISIISEALGGSNVDNCPHACVARPCGPLAECVPNLENYECQCNPRNTQCNKAEELTSDQLNNEKNFVQISSGNHDKYRNGDDRNVDKENNEENDDYYYYEYDEVDEDINDDDDDDDDNDNNNDPNHNNRNNNGKIIIRVDKTLKKLRNSEAVQSANALLLKTTVRTTTVTTPSTTTTTIKSTTTTRTTTTTTPIPPPSAYVEKMFNQNSFFSSDDDLIGEDIDQDKDNGDSDSNGDNDNDDDDEDNDNSDKIMESKYMSFNDNDNSEEFFYKSHNKKHNKIKTDNPMKKHNHKHNKNKDNNKKMKSGQHKPIKPKQKHAMSYRPEDDTVIDEILIDDMDKIMKDESPSIKRITVINEDASAADRDNDDDDDDDDNGDVVLATEEDAARQRGHSRSYISAATDVIDEERRNGGVSFIQDTARNDPAQMQKYKSKLLHKYHGACFTGTDSYFHYSDGETMRRIISYQIDLNLRFRTHSAHGVILWSGRHSAHEDDDFLSLGIENGYLHLRYNLGSGDVNIKYNSTIVSDGLWHRVRAMRNLQEGTLKVDGGKPIVQRSPGKLRQLNTDTGLYVGGMPNTQFYTRQTYASGINGCISEVILGGELRLNLDSKTLGIAHNVEVEPGAP